MVSAHARARRRGTSPRGREGPRPPQASTTDFAAAVSPVTTTLRPGREAPRTSAGATTVPSASVTGSPRCSRPARGRREHRAARPARGRSARGAPPRRARTRERARHARPGMPRRRIRRARAVRPRPRRRARRVGQPAEDPPESAQQLVEAGRPVDREWRLPSAEGERLQHPGQSEVVIGVVVREEDLVELDEADVAAQQLALRALPAVDQEPLAAPPDERRAERALCGRHGSRRPEEHDVQIHGGRLY